MSQCEVMCLPQPLIQLGLNGSKTPNINGQEMQLQREPRNDPTGRLNIIAGKSETNCKIMP
jgi:hypothetical protein